MNWGAVRSLTASWLRPWELLVGAATSWQVRPVVTASVHAWQRPARKELSSHGICISASVHQCGRRKHTQTGVKMAYAHHAPGGQCSTKPLRTEQHAWEAAVPHTPPAGEDASLRSHRPRRVLPAGSRSVSVALSVGLAAFSCAQHMRHEVLKELVQRALNACSVHTVH
jgi:hypothetical protein